LYPERFYQTRSASFSVGGSLTDAAVLKQEDLRYGRLPKDSSEVILDRMTIKYLLEGTPQVKMVNMHTPEDFLGKQLGLTNGINYTVVGITDLQEPNIYLNRDQFIPALYYSYPSGEDYDGTPYLQMARAKYADSPYQIYSEEESNSLLSYELEKERYSLKQGRLPENAYECLLPYEQRDVYPLGKVTDIAIGKQKLKVVGYYTTNDTSLTTALVSNQTLLYDLVQGAKKYTICPKTADCYDNLAKEEYKVINLLQRAENDYRKARKETVRSTILLGGIIIAISLIELFLISRSSFLSRIKEVGTLRAIGMKKWDVYKIFVGEVLAITTLTDLPAMILTFFFIQWGISAYPSVSMFFYQTPLFLLAAVFLIYLFNLLVGLLPVWNTMRKRPAAILARYDID
ncbi:MAG TPA: ABC transporter permease, partial [Clostridiales bacterium]|nr:ABC transporter permease [Clostridiales bacterium]